MAEQVLLALAFSLKTRLGVDGSLACRWLATLAASLSSTLNIEVGGLTMSIVTKPDWIRVARHVLAVVGMAIGVATAGVELVKLVRDLNTLKPAQYMPAVESNTCEDAKK